MKNQQKFKIFPDFKTQCWLKRGLFPALCKFSWISGAGWRSPCYPRRSHWYIYIYIYMLCHGRTEQWPGGTSPPPPPLEFSIRKAKNSDNFKGLLSPLPRYATTRFLASWMAKLWRHRLFAKKAAPSQFCMYQIASVMHCSNFKHVESLAIEKKSVESYKTMRELK